MNLILLWFINQTSNKNNNRGNAVDEYNPIRFSEMKVVRNKYGQRGKKENRNPEHDEQFAEIPRRIRAAPLANLFQKNIYAKRPEIRLLQSVQKNKHDRI